MSEISPSLRNPGWFEALTHYQGMITLALLSHSKQRRFFLVNQVLTCWARSFWLSMNASAHKSWMDDTLLRAAPTSYLPHQLKVFMMISLENNKIPWHWALNRSQLSPSASFWSKIIVLIQQHRNFKELQHEGVSWGSVRIHLVAISMLGISRDVNLHCLTISEGGPSTQRTHTCRAVH